MKDRILDFFSGIIKTLAPYKKNVIIPLLKILGIILVCAILVRLIGGNETLEDYARENPELAYPSVTIEENTP